MSTYVANTEKAKIPAVALGFADQINFARNVGLINGVPNLRWVDVPRVGGGEERVSQFLDPMLKALTEPLTAKEKESGLYTPPEPPRVIFEGTLADAQVFFQQTTPVNNCRNCPIAKYTDGLPIIIPTEENVKEMLTGTKHGSYEEIKYPVDMDTGIPGFPSIVKAGTRATYARGYYATVEKVATVAVMAGCKPEYLPIVLAIATAGGGTTSCPGTSEPDMWLYIVSGPIAKEIGMNAGQNAMDIGNQANMTIGRSANLMSVNFGQCITGVVRTSQGNPVNKGLCFAEDDESLPQGWVALREEGGYTKTQNSIGRLGHPFMRMTMGEFAPSAFRGLIGEGYGGVARRLGVEGKPGPHNFLEYIVPLLIPSCANICQGEVTFVMSPNMAKSLYDFGFKTKMAVYQWLWDNFYVTAKELRAYGWYDFRTAAGANKEALSDKPYKDLPDNHKLHVFGNRGPTNNCVVVSVGFADELCFSFQGGRPIQYGIDVWK